MFFCYGHVSVDRPGNDFLWYWLGAKALIHGQNPYLIIQPGGAFHLDAPFVYPITTAFIALPFSAWLPPAWATMLFVGVSSALISWGITRKDFALLPIFGSAPFLWASASGQMSLLITAGALIPALSWVAAGKPNIGLAAFAYRPSRWAVTGSLLLIAVGLAVNHHWVSEWLTAVGTRSERDYGKGIPLLMTGGPLLLLALTRWRRPEARLLLVLACIPQTLMFYDQLLLWLIPKTRIQSATLGLLSIVGWQLGNAALPLDPTHGQAGAVYWPMVFATCYMPALAMIMREPNTGSVPDWLERFAARSNRGKGVVWPIAGVERDRK